MTFVDNKYLDCLIEGNERYVNGKPIHPNSDQSRRDETKNGQKPFAVIIGCSDSRVPLEIVFDQGIGDLFIVRVAGNVIGPVELASIEFAVLHLGAPLICIVGHQNCGAINAVYEGKTEGIEAVASLVDPTIDRDRKEPDYTLLDAIQSNVKYGKESLKRQSSKLKNLIDDGKLEVVGGVYSLSDGKVNWLDQD